MRLRVLIVMSPSLKMRTTTPLRRQTLDLMTLMMIPIMCWHRSRLRAYRRLAKVNYGSLIRVSGKRLLAIQKLPQPISRTCAMCLLPMPMALRTLPSRLETMAALLMAVSILIHLVTPLPLTSLQ